MECLFRERQVSFMEKNPLPETR